MHQTTPKYKVAYCVNSAAANIFFLSGSYILNMIEQLPQKLILHSNPILISTLMLSAIRKYRHILGPYFLIWQLTGFEL